MQTPTSQKLPEVEREAPGRRRRRWPLLVAIAVIVVVGLVVAGFALRTNTSAPGTGQAVAPATPFELTLTGYRGAFTGKAQPAAVHSVAKSVRSTLRSFYAGAFLTPAAWAGTPPAATWDAFAATSRPAAQADAGSLTIERRVGGISSLRAGRSTVRVVVLVDSKGNPVSAIASTSFSASGTLTSGGTVDVSQSGRFVLQPVGGRWLITGYPKVTTRVHATPASGSSS